jgi:hypothetical protein
LIEGKYVLLEYLAIGNDNKEARRFSFVTPATIKLGKRNMTTNCRGKTYHIIIGDYTLPLPNGESTKS